MATVPRNPDWRREFCEALKQKRPLMVQALLDEYEGTMALTTTGHGDRYEDPLRIALAEVSAWGVDQLLQRNQQRPCPWDFDQALPGYMRTFFAQARQGKRPAQEYVATWEALLPALLASVPRRQHTLALYLDVLNNRWDLPLGMDWASLHMDQIGEGVFHLGYHLEFPEETMTPLQRAWRAENMEAMERLLDHGASPVEPDASSLLPDWTLKKTVDDMPASQLGSEWSGVLARLKAVDLDERLPPPSRGKPSLRF
jgi:hypothetical protein